MANDSGNVFSGKPAATGGVLTNPINTGKPTTATSTLTGWTPTGYVSVDGVTRSESRSSSETKEWGGVTIKKSQNGFEATLQFQFLEYLAPEPAKAIYGDGAVTTTAASATHGTQMVVTVKGTEAPRLGWLFDMVDGDASGRIYVGVGQVTDVGDTVYSTDGGAVRDVTVTCYPDANGDLFVEFTDDGRTT